MRSEHEIMLAGEMYRPTDPELTTMRTAKAYRKNSLVFFNYFNLLRKWSILHPPKRATHHRPLWR